MSNILLCGLFHDINKPVSNDSSTKGLMDDVSQVYFDTHILPKINNRSVLLVEGWSGIKRAGDKVYEARLNYVSESFVHQRINPLLIGCDIRGKDVEDFYKLLYHDDTALRAQFDAVYFDELPQNYEQLATFARAEKGNFRMTRELTLKEKQSVRVVQKKNAEFDTYCASMVKQNPGQDCFVVAGLIHCLHLHLLHGWPLEICRSTEEIPKFLIEVSYYAYFNKYLWRP